MKQKTPFNAHDEPVTCFLFELLKLDELENNYKNGCEITTLQMIN